MVRRDSLVYMLFYFLFLTFASSLTVRSFLFPNSSYVCEGLDGNSTNGNFTNAVGETASLEHFRFLSGSSTVSAFVNARPPTPTGLPPRHACFSTGYHGPALPLSFRWQKISPSNRTSRFSPFRQLSRPLSATVLPSAAFSDGRSTTQPARMFSLVCAMRFGSGSFLLRFRRRNSVRAAKYDLWCFTDVFWCFADLALGDRCSAGILSGLLSMWDCICFTYLGAKLVSSIHTSLWDSSLWDWCAYGVIAAFLLVPFWVMKPPALCPCAIPGTKTGVIF